MKNALKSNSEVTGISECQEVPREALDFQSTSTYIHPFCAAASCYCIFLKQENLSAMTKS